MHAALYFCLVAIMQIKMCLHHTLFIVLTDIESKG